MGATKKRGTNVYFIGGLRPQSAFLAAPLARTLLNGPFLTADTSVSKSVWHF